ncbi:hypothetical protein [Campylobacter sp.]|uniref:hypothetical protein n=1 Tax=Campylobacter sp. TaxID=205 RepID=UPI002A83FA11|nr:hypothetical protein [Campylobacter sp.]MDY4154711.1 hypothetical protein [Campylobacter sp.]
MAFMPPQPKIDINLSSKDFADLMEKKENNSPKCPKCDSNEHVVLIKTFTKAGAVVGGVAGAAGGAAAGATAGGAAGRAIDGIRDRYQCNKCGAEFDG